MTVVRTSAADLAAVQACFFASVSVLTEADYTVQQRRAWIDRALALQDTWREKLSRFSWKIVEQGRVMGFVSVTPQDCMLDWLYVTPEAANTGAATFLLREAEHTARIMGVDELNIEASITGQRFFARRGYKIIEQQLVDIDGCILPNALMRKNMVV